MAACPQNTYLAIQGLCYTHVIDIETGRTYKCGSAPPARNKVQWSEDRRHLTVDGTTYPTAFLPEEVIQTAKKIFADITGAVGKDLASMLE